VTIPAVDPPVNVGVTDNRIIEASPAARMVHRAILRTFATTGHPPAADTLITPGDRDLAAVLAELHERDIICLGETGQIRAAYPFSVSATPHQVEIADGPTVYAMCAIDALGMGAMLDRDTVIRSADANSGEPVTVVIRNGQTAWRPATAVVYVGIVATDCGDSKAEDDAACGALVPAADRCCTVMNFFTDPDSAAQWQTNHPDVTGAVLDQDAALRRGIGIFGHLLKE
jgi:hypothetical protein